MNQVHTVSGWRLAGLICVAALICVAGVALIARGGGDPPTGTSTAQKEIKEVTPQFCPVRDYQINSLEGDWQALTNTEAARLVVRHWGHNPNDTSRDGVVRILSDSRFNDQRFTTEHLLVILWIYESVLDEAVVGWALTVPAEAIISELGVDEHAKKGIDYLYRNSIHHTNAGIRGTTIKCLRHTGWHSEPDWRERIGPLRDDPEEYVRDQAHRALLSGK